MSHKALSSSQFPTLYHGTDAKIPIGATIEPRHGFALLGPVAHATSQPEVARGFAADAVSRATRVTPDHQVKEGDTHYVYTVSPVDEGEVRRTTRAAAANLLGMRARKGLFPGHMVSSRGFVVTGVHEEVPATVTVGRKTQAQRLLGR